MPAGTLASRIGFSFSCLNGGERRHVHILSRCQLGTLTGKTCDFFLDLSDASLWVQKKVRPGSSSAFFCFWLRVKSHPDHLISGHHRQSIFWSIAIARFQATTVSPFKPNCTLQAAGVSRTGAETTQKKRYAIHGHFRYTGAMENLRHH